MRYLLYDTTFSVTRKRLFGIKKFKKSCIVRLDQDHPTCKDSKKVIEILTKAWTQEHSKDSIRVLTVYLSGAGYTKSLVKGSIVSPPLIVFRQ